MKEYRKILKYSGKVDENSLEFGETFGEIVELFGEEFENYLGSDDQGEIPDGRSISNKPKKMKKKFYKLKSLPKNYNNIDSVINGRNYNGFLLPFL